MEGRKFPGENMTAIISGIWIMTKALIKLICIIAALPLAAMSIFALVQGEFLYSAVSGGIGLFLLAFGLFVIRVRRKEG